MGFFAVDVDFGEEGEGDAIVGFAECGNFFFCAGFLMFELVTGEAENDEPFILIIFV